MALDGCAVLCKYTIFFFNLIFTLVGFAFLVFGMCLSVSPGPGSSFETNYVTFVGVAVLIVLGLLMLTMVTFGIYGACSENRCALHAFSVLLALLALAEGLFGFVAYSNCCEICLEVLSILNESSLVIGIFFGTEAVLITALICSIVLRCNIHPSVSLPQYIALTYSTPALNIQQSQYEFSTYSYPHPEKDPGVFPALIVENIPGIQAKCT